MNRHFQTLDAIFSNLNFYKLRVSGIDATPKLPEASLRTATDAKATVTEAKAYGCGTGEPASGSREIPNHSTNHKGAR